VLTYVGPFLALVAIAHKRADGPVLEGPHAPTPVPPLSAPAGAAP
jgi:hypothetical protein